MKEYEKSKLNRVKRGQNRATYDVEKINTILDAGFLCYVGYIYDGKPITIPMAYTRRDDKIYIHGSTANRMLLSILESEETSITVMHLDGLVLARSGLHHSVNYRSVTLFGSLNKIEKDEEKTATLKWIVNQMMPNHWDSLRPMYQKELDRTLVVEFTIETASAKVRDTGVADEPEDYALPIWAGIVPIKQVAEYPISDKGKPEEMGIPQHVLDYYEKNK
ncbi:MULTISPECIES: pyridoxamine 5'-phosphate oxidase family protein [Tenacibaculum]|uniref:pyridoxamine 5'-phosphate oxidase family protein n=1 Tax=Tenacibaculum TaxID=104267 RepID=UPI001F0A771C|nr:MULTISPECIES: pyridoxamine 5'-phosphate oxidase family protein [Tenacibaculum]MCH3882586.1 pyridoxamine 5'-phosphate oxidase family protein [Tenacibaculum aquimarinum]MDO6600613.1 pyridoxamine 5'-phosphate oxidase family protein [Tenacibaculum sp. 1_MG-2023]